MKLDVLKDIVNLAFDSGSPVVDRKVLEAVDEVVARLDRGEIRVCNLSDGKWTLNEWIKKAILLYFRTHKVSLLESTNFSFVDKVPIKK
jgi:2,3,4,5-tetrahydropyridine-2-carboxylate N-succinyltransferase